MPLSDISAGKNVPDEVYAIIENPMGGDPVKYELDKDTGVIFVDRFLHTAMQYPGNYGFIPKTLSGDGDPVDVLVLGQTAVMPGCVMSVRPVGVLMMEDESGVDEKIIAVPAHSLHPYHDDVKGIDDIRPILREKIEHFFSHYKDLEKGKWAKVAQWGDVDQAKALILEGLERANQS
jgi:inorganic pyrophosphatase